MKAGTYYIGDLCYVMSGEDWSSLLLTIKDSNGDYQDGEFTLPNGVEFAIYSTANGDGLYYDDVGASYSVDSGTIGCILLEDINAKYQESIDTLGNIVTFDEDFDTGCHSGEIVFHELSIQTGSDYSYIDGDDEYDYDDDDDDDDSYFDEDYR